MGLVLFVIGAVLGVQYYKRTHVPSSSPSSQYSGATDPILNRSLGNAVPVTQNEPITEAAYHQYPTGEIVPALGASVLEVNGSEFLV